MPSRWPDNGLSERHILSPDGAGRQGNTITGWCISLLNMMSREFATPPTFFKEDTDKDSITTTMSDVFHILSQQLA
jgi:hypothetical protein